VHGRRLVIRADGHGQSVALGEADDTLFVLQHWSVMGYLQGSIEVHDADTLERRLEVPFEDDLEQFGIDARGHFVVGLRVSTPGERKTTTRWRAWRTSDWQPVELSSPPDAGRIRCVRLSAGRALPASR